ncbi:MAG: ABC transporter permease, partial [Planctomycetes bacterium]|nr:ABC transporter permease [Planctomycetota bacterium]
GFYIEQQAGVDDRELSKRIQAVFLNRDVKRWTPSLFGSGEEGILEDGSNLISLFNRGLKTLLSGNEKPPNGSNLAPDDGETNSTPKGVPETKATETRPDKNAKQSEQLPIEVRSAADWAERFEEFSSDLDIFLSIMTGIGVTIAVLSIVNTMLMSVTERVIEFGILKANGWTKLDVLKLITFESATLGLGGGILGASLGWVATQMINSHWPTRVNLFASPGLLLFSVFFSTALGILGGLYPAVWAMRMMPMDAIRRG